MLKPLSSAARFRPRVIAIDPTSNSLVLTCFRKHARIRIDMSSQTHINATRRGWPRCKTVTAVSGRFECTLDYGSAYAFEDAYAEAPHAAFLKATDNDELAQFIKDWGPLELFDSNGKASVEIAACWAYKRRLRSQLALYDAFKRQWDNEGDLREALRSHAVAEAGDPRRQAPRMWAIGSWAFPRPASVIPIRWSKEKAEEWLRRASLPILRNAVAVAIEQSLLVSGRLIPRIEDRSRRIEARWLVTNLAQALRLMIFLDYQREQPLRICWECGGVFIPKPTNKRKYCDSICAHRATARTWAARKRALDREKVPGRQRR
jgi:hypothetical protein